MLRTKSVPVRIKAAGTHEGTDEGVFEAIVATYDLDSVGDKILPGAFKTTLEEWTKSGDPIPVLWSHQWGDPDSHIGVVEDAKETDDGLWVKARLDLDEPRAAKIYRLMKGRRIKQFSFGYEVPSGGQAFVEGKDGQPSYVELRELNLFELGPCLVGANQATSLQDVKTTPAVGLTEQRVAEIATAAVHQALADKARATEQPTPEQSTLAALLNGITRIAHTTQHDEKATPPEPAADETPTGGKSDRPATDGTASLRVRTDLATITAQVLALEDEDNTVEEDHPAAH